MLNETRKAEIAEQIENKKDIVNILQSIQSKCLEDKMKALKTIYSEKFLCDVLNKLANSEIVYFQEEIIHLLKFLNS